MHVAFFGWFLLLIARLRNRLLHHRGLEVAHDYGCIARATLGKNPCRTEARLMRDPDANTWALHLRLIRSSGNLKAEEAHAWLHFADIRELFETLDELDTFARPLLGKPSLVGPTAPVCRAPSDEARLALREARAVCVYDMGRVDRRPEARPGVDVSLALARADKHTPCVLVGLDEQAWSVWPLACVARLETLRDDLRVRVRPRRSALQALSEELVGARGDGLALGLQDAR